MKNEENKMTQPIPMHVLCAYLPYGVKCSYLDLIQDKRIKAILTGVSTDEVQTTYPRKKRGCSGDYISFKRANNILDLKFKLLLRPLSDLSKPLAELDGKTAIEKVNEMLEKVYGGEGRDVEVDEFIESMIEFDWFMPHGLRELLLSHHFDLFEAIQNGWALDLNGETK